MYETCFDVDVNKTIKQNWVTTREIERLNIR